MCFRRFFSLLVVLGLNSWPHACWHNPWPLCCISSPLRLTFNCWSGKNFTTNGRNFLKTLPGLVLTCASLIRARARKPLVSSPWKTAPLFFLHTVCFLKVRPTSILGGPLPSSPLPSSSLRYSVATSLPLPRTAQRADVMRSCGS